jgi:hypothetical protein
LRRIEAVHPVAQADGKAFVGGARLKLRRGIVEAAALRALAELQQIGVLAEIEANRPPDEAILSLGSLDQFHDSEIEPSRPSSGIKVDANKLTMLDDDEESMVRPFQSRQMTQPDVTGLGEEGETHREARAASLGEEGVTHREGRAASLGEEGETRKLSSHALEVTTAPMQLPHDQDGRATVVGDVRPAARNPFEPVETTTAPLQLDRKPLPSTRVPPPSARLPLPSTRLPAPLPPIPDEDGLGTEGTTSKYVPPPERSQPHERLDLDDIGADPVVDGNILRQKPGLRIGIGVIVGLGLGWMVSQPYAGRAERHVAELRAEANKERYRPVDEARARVAALDERADEEATRGALGSAAIWMLVGAATFAAWWRFS